MPTVEETILGYLKDYTSPGFTPALEHRLLEDLNLDSLDIVELSMHLEESLDIILDDDDGIRKSKTVGDLVSFIRKRTGLQ